MADFERVSHQVGAVVLMDNRVVGIERAPNHAYWASVWSSLIRECYGSLAIEVARRKGPSAEAPAWYVPLRGKVRGLDALADAVFEADARQNGQAVAIVRKVGTEPLASDLHEQIGDLRLETISSGAFVGQWVRDRGTPVYASLVASRRASKEAGSAGRGEMFPLREPRPARRGGPVSDGPQ